MITATLWQTAPLQTAGLIGAGLCMLNYTLPTTRILSADNVTYFCVDLAAALLVRTSLTGAFNAATLVIQVFFVGVSLCGIAMRLRRYLALRARARASAATPDEREPGLRDVLQPVDPGPAGAARAGSLGALPADVAKVGAR